MRRVAIIVAAYVVGAFLTYGYAYNNSPHSGGVRRDDHAMMAGGFWPLYWASYPIAYVGRLAIEVTK